MCLQHVSQPAPNLFTAAVDEFTTARSINHIDKFFFFCRRCFYYKKKKVDQKIVIFVCFCSLEKSVVESGCLCRVTQRFRRAELFQRRFWKKLKGLFAAVAAIRKLQGRHWRERDPAFPRNFFTVQTGIAVARIPDTWMGSSREESATCFSGRIF